MIMIRIMATRTYYTPSDTLVEAVRGFEGLRLKAYKDSAGKLTIGYGHARNVKEGMRITKEQADGFLAQDMATAAMYVNRQQVCRTQGQFDALVDFAFNLGTGSLSHSTLMYYVRTGRSTADIQAQFRRWVYAGKKKLPGLVKRREWEARRWAE